MAEEKKTMTTAQFMTAAHAKLKATERAPRDVTQGLVLNAKAKDFLSASARTTDDGRIVATQAIPSGRAVYLGSFRSSGRLQTHALVQQAIR